MTKKITSSKRIVPFVGMIILAFTVSALFYISVIALQAALTTPIDDGDQRDLEFFVSLYYLISAIAFMCALPLLILFVTQITHLVKGRQNIKKPS